MIVPFHRLALQSWLLVVAACGASSAASAATFRVGSDGACTHTNLLAAIGAASANGPAQDEIRVASNQPYTGQILAIAAHSVRIVGGYANCGAATPSGRTVIAGTAAGANGTITTSGTAINRILVQLENLELRGGGNLTSRRGGALRIGGRFEVVLRNLRITENQAGRGGGIYIDGSDVATLQIDSGTSIDNNTAGVSGGGIYCVGDAEVSLNAAIVEDNGALDGATGDAESGNGGGIALYDQCRVIHSGVSGNAGVRDNYAERYGGGYYARGADLFLLGSSTAPASVVGNRADVAGGGIAVNDDFSGGNPGAILSEIRIDDSRVDDNSSPEGAGLGIVAGGQVTMRRTLFGTACHDDVRCSTLSDNRAEVDDGFCLGAALSAGLGSAVQIRQTFIEDNCRLTHGDGVRVADNARVRIDSSVMANNGDAPFQFAPTFDGTLDFSWSTMTRNLNAPASSLMVLPTDATATGDVRLFGSIIAEPIEHIRAANASPMSVTIDCIVLDTTFVDPTVPFRAAETTAPWGMVAPATGDFRLASDLTALPVDFCDASILPRIAGDMAGVVTPVDAPRANLYGDRDVGAYELVGAGGDTVFADGFE